ncbi:MAG: RNA polymerase sigma factor [Terriglobales bacterium]
MPTRDVQNDMEAVMPRLGVPVGAADDCTRTTAVSKASGGPRAHQFELMRRCQQAEAGAFEELVQAFSPRVSAIVRGVLRNSNDCDDIAQQVFAKVYFGLRKFNFQSAVSTWIYKIAVNECYDHLRKMKVRRATIMADLSEEESARVENLDVAGRSGMASPERQMEMRELAAKLMARLSPEDRTLLMLKEVEGYSVRETAEILGMNENTVKVRLFRARQALLAALERKRI